MPTSSGHTQAILAKKVIGTNVENMKGEKLGTIEDVVLDKSSNNVMFAVLSFGGFLGMAEKYHPVPWPMLDYAKDRDAYVVDVTRAQLEAAPADSMEALTRDDGHGVRDRAYQFYQTPRYW